MLTCSMLQALGLWSELWRAYYKENGFGGPAAEVYAYTLLPADPMATTSWESEMRERARGLAACEASHNLHVLLCHFAKEARAKVTVDDVHVFFPGSAPAGLPPERHKWHITVEAMP